MEVRIKDNNGYVDADWTIEDGIMIVSPKVEKFEPKVEKFEPKDEKFEPKDGDVIHCTNSICSYVAIFRNIFKCGTFFYRYAILIDSEELKININGCDYSGYSNPRPATEEEKQNLFYRLAEEGYEFDFEKKKLVKLKWKPKVGDKYHYPLMQHYK